MQRQGARGRPLARRGGLDQVGFVPRFEAVQQERLVAARAEADGDAGAADGLEVAALDDEGRPFI